MSQSEKMITILDEIEKCLQSIDGGTEYFNTIKHTNIHRKYMPIEACNGYPAVCVASIDNTNSKPLDIGYTSYESTLSAEIFGYVLEENVNTLDKVLELAQDMEKSIYANESLSGNIWNLSLDILTATNQEQGVVRINLRAQLEYIK
jgi:hypothetical protein